jgi:ferritin-like metal-binding protein YciE
MSKIVHEQLVRFLSDMYSVEQQALTQMDSAPDLAGDPSLTDAFRRRRVEMENHVGLVRQLVEIHGGSISTIKGAVIIRSATCAAPSISSS